MASFVKILKSLIPDKYFPWVIDFHDRLLNKFFRHENGFYVDVGAYHPRHFSNTFLLHSKKKWRGINIDPSPYCIKLFRAARPNDINLQIGISRDSSVKNFFMFSHSNCNTFSKEKAEEWRKKSNVHFLGESQVECLPLREVFDKYLPPKKVIDLLNIDTEGLDLEVLESNDWTKYRPRVIVVECSDFDPACPINNLIFSFLLKKSYKLRSFFGLSLIFVTNE